MACMLDFVLETGRVGLVYESVRLVRRWIDQTKTYTLFDNSIETQ